MACRRESLISFSAQQLNVTPDVGTSGSNTAMSRKDIIAALKDTCKALEEKKLSLEAIIASLEQEEA
jgi:hypothetical protein